MSQKFKKHYTGFNRQILAEFMSEDELKRLDDKYNEAKVARVKRKYLLTKTPKERKKQDIIDFFKLVCQGIRNEYEDGASHRNQNVDLNTLRNLLKKI